MAQAHIPSRNKVSRLQKVLLIQRVAFEAGLNVAARAVRVFLGANNGIICLNKRGRGLPFRSKKGFANPQGFF
jgi:hypothetical protein